MTNFGYTLMTEQSGPRELVRYAVAAEDLGFDFEVMSDHYSPWLTEQGHAPHAWTVLGAVAQATSRVGLMTYVTCPTLRYHPAVVAQKAATLQILAEGRFTLGLGSGENLNEHVVGEGWPAIQDRQDMLAEAVEIIRALHTGKLLLPGILPLRGIAAARGQAAPVPSERRVRAADVAVQTPGDEVDALAIEVVQQRQATTLPDRELVRPRIVVAERLRTEFRYACMFCWRIASAYRRPQVGRAGRAVAVALVSRRRHRLRQPSRLRVDARRCAASTWASAVIVGVRRKGESRERPPTSTIVPVTLMRCRRCSSSRRRGGAAWRVPQPAAARDRQGHDAWTARGSRHVPRAG